MFLQLLPLLSRKNILFLTYAGPNIFSLTLETHPRTSVRIFPLDTVQSDWVTYLSDMKATYAHDPILYSPLVFLYSLPHIPALANLSFYTQFYLLELYTYIWFCNPHNMIFAIIYCITTTSIFSHNCIDLQVIL